MNCVTARLWEDCSTALRQQHRRQRADWSIALHAASTNEYLELSKDSRTATPTSTARAGLTDRLSRAAMVGNFTMGHGKIIHMLVGQRVPNGVHTCYGYRWSRLASNRSRNSHFSDLCESLIIRIQHRRHLRGSTRPDRAAPADPLSARL